MIRFLSLCLLALGLFSCLEDECDEVRYYTVYEPVIIAASEWRNNEFSLVGPESVCEPAGFYVYGDLLFVLDKQKGLHIIDNGDNDNPTPLAFLEIPGGSGLAVRNGILYVSQYIDLLAFDLKDPTQPALLSRTENVFDSSSDFTTNMMGNGDVVIDVEVGTEQIEIDCSNRSQSQPYFWYDDVLYADSRDMAIVALNNANFATPTREVVGVGGSLARFTINEGTLYVVDDYNLRTFSLAEPAAPEFVTLTQLGWGIETIFPYEDKLFIGAQQGMHIYGLEDPNQPTFLSTFQHVRSCDPVVVQNDIAYVTMWGGSSCGDATDRLMVVDVSDARAPQLLQDFSMENSHGLGVDADHLFLCSGEDGLRVFDLQENGQVAEEVHHLRGFSAKDVIVLPARRELIALGWEQAGITQFDYDANGLPQPVSEIAVCP